LSPDEPRLRAGWRLAGHSLILLFFVLLTSVAIAIPLAILGFTDLEGLSQYILLATSLAFLPSITLSTWIARRWLDRRSFRSLGLELDRTVLRDLGVGFIIPLPLFTLIYLVESAFGWLEFQRWGWDETGLVIGLGSVFAMLVVFAAVGFYEELLYRGYYLVNLTEGTNLPVALLLSALVFALAHLGNFSASLASTVGIFVAAFFLAYGWLRTRSLWLPIGLHIGWNFFQGPIFGFQVSGNPTPALIHHSVTGPDLITGGAFGPEAGLIALPAMAVGIGLIWVYTRGRVISHGLLGSEP
jgi:membrane protease YdiL (CAAX protease family)